MFQVEIVEYETDKVVKQFEPQVSERMAERIDGGVNINLDHERFYTRIVEVVTEQTQPAPAVTGGAIRCEDCGEPVVTHGKRCGGDVRPGDFD